MNKQVVRYIGQFLSFSFPKWIFTAKEMTEKVEGQEEPKIVPNHYLVNIKGNDIDVTLTIRLEFSSNSRIPNYYLIMGNEEDVLDDYAESALMIAILRSIDNPPVTEPVQTTMNN